MPPHEAFRFALSEAATGAGQKRALLLGAEKAHVHAPSGRDACVEFPRSVRARGSAVGYVGVFAVHGACRSSGGGPQ
eukprot:4848545-Alexandrium_andersonii.AAC.1